MKEQWRDIKVKELDGLYMVSNLGRVKRLHHFDKVNTILGWRLVEKPERIEPIKVLTTSYGVVTLGFRGKIHQYHVDVLVVQSFPEECGKWSNNCTVDHLNGETLDNRSCNLKVVRKTKKQTEKHSQLNRDDMSIPIIATNLLTHEETNFSSQNEASRVLKIDFRLISSCLLEKQRKTHGYTFRYA